MIPLYRPGAYDECFHKRIVFGSEYVPIFLNVCRHRKPFLNVFFCWNDGEWPMLRRVSTNSKHISKRSLHLQCDVWGFSLCPLETGKTKTNKKKEIRWEKFSNSTTPVCWDIQSNRPRRGFISPKDNNEKTKKKSLSFLWHQNQNQHCTKCARLDMMIIYRFYCARQLAKICIVIYTERKVDICFRLQWRSMEMPLLQNAVRTCVSFYR